jgi:murein DD-endopeptidase MepM/ murein hydrolase activator NlpD
MLMLASALVVAAQQPASSRLDCNLEARWPPERMVEFGPILEAYESGRITGPVVALVQRAMAAALGEDLAQADGWFGPGSALLTQRYQRQEGLTVDGIVGPQVYRRLAEQMKPLPKRGPLNRWRLNGKVFRYDPRVGQWGAWRLPEYDDDGDRSCPRDNGVPVNPTIIEPLPRPAGSLVCPVAGAKSYDFTNDWGAPRSGGRTHKGNDIYAARGTAVVAPESGRVEFSSNNLGGRVFRLYADSGAYYYGAHLDAVVGVDRRVSAGETVATVGNTGNAITTPPHLHLEMRPGGQDAERINPYFVLLAICQ